MAKPKRLWYVLSVTIGRERWLRTQITKKARIDGIEGVGRIMIPVHTEERKRAGVWQKQNRKSFPGYLIIHMVYNEDTHSLIERMEKFGVHGLLPLRPRDDGFKIPRKEPRQKRPMQPWENEVIEEWAPTSLTSVEAAIVMLMKKVKHKQVQPKEEEEKKPCNVGEGSQVKILSGMFEGMNGVVKKVQSSQDGYFCTVDLTLMGKRTPIGINSKELEEVE
jgi:transcription antitermination factor NusG